MFFRTQQAEPSTVPEPSELLREAVAAHMPEADDETVAIVGAIGGLLARVAHADGRLDASELAEIREQLGRIDGLAQSGVEAVCALVEEHGGPLAVEGIQSYTRVLYERTERGMRVEVLDVLLDLAASDGVISLDETNLLRRVANALGLDDAEYNASQQRHRARLSVLKA